MYTKRLVVVACLDEDNKDDFDVDIRNSLNDCF